MSGNTEDIFDGLGQEKIGVAKVLPAVVAARLVSAAAAARALPAESLERKQEIEKAIYFARTQCPQAFRDRGENRRS
jgi:hypothetical protein